MTNGNDTVYRRDWSQVWKWVAAILAGLLLGVLEGQFVPNRNIMTRSDMAPFYDQITAINTKLDVLSTAVAKEQGMREGEEEAKRKLDQ